MIQTNGMEEGLRVRRRKKRVKRRAVIESLVPLSILGAVIAFAPLNSSQFPIVAIVACVAVVIYAIYGLWRLPGSCERWRLLPPPLEQADAFGRGCLLMAGLIVLGLIPIAVVKFFEVPMPYSGGPWLYFFWCIIQDFIFFALIMRSLEEMMHPTLAIALTATAFGLSHYPHWGLMAMTALVAGAWGFLFLTSRWLPYVTLAHWTMGFILLA
jgi:hypothetical protein